mgnify:CR=1 FL=1
MWRAIGSGKAIGAACRPYDADLQESGHLLEVGSLAPTRSSVTIRPRGGKRTVTDGPFAETKEQLGSYFLIEAESLEEAIEIASKHPAANLNEHLGWGVELRPIEVCRVARATDAGDEPAHGGS